MGNECCTQCCPWIFNVEPQIQSNRKAYISKKTEDSSDSSIKNPYGKNTNVQQKKLLVAMGKDKKQIEYVSVSDLEEGDGDPVEKIKPAFNPFQRSAGNVFYI